MKAIVYYNYGSPDVLKCKEIEKPTAGEDEVLLKVCAASVNPLDWHFMRGPPYFVRIQVHEAIRYPEAGHARGKVVITLECNKNR